jgi:putative ABC transport system permease protein
MKFFYLVWTNLKRRKLRAMLTVLSILVAFILFGLLSAIREGLSGGVNLAGMDRLMVRHKVAIILFLPESYKERILRIPGVEKAVHCIWFGGIYQEPRNYFPQIVVEPESLLEIYPEYVLPDEAREEWLRTRTGAIVGRRTAERFGWEVGDRIPIQATIWTKEDGSNLWEFDLVGIYDAGKKGTDTTQFFFRYDYFDESRAFAKGQVGWYVVRVENPEEAAEVAQRIDAEFANSPEETKAETEMAFVRGFAQQIGDIGKIMMAILSAVFFTILLVAGNTMAQSVRERTAEIGVLKAIGFSHRMVLGLVLAESCFLAVAGGMIGLALALLFTAGGDPTGGALPNFYFPTRDLLQGIALVFLLGLAAGIFPAWQAMRLQVAEALRREG